MHIVEALCLRCSFFSLSLFFLSFSQHFKAKKKAFKKFVGEGEKNSFPCSWHICARYICWNEKKASSEWSICCMFYPCVTEIDCMEEWKDRWHDRQVIGLLLLQTGSETHSFPSCISSLSWDFVIHAFERKKRKNCRMNRKFSFSLFSVELADRKVLPWAVRERKRRR